MLTNNCLKNNGKFAVIFSDCKKNKFYLTQFVVVVSNLAIDLIHHIAFIEAVVFVMKNNGIYVSSEQSMPKQEK